MVSRAFSALCFYSKFGHHTHALGYICVEFCFVASIAGAYDVREPKLLLRNIKTYVCIRMYVYVYVTCKPMTFTFTTSMNTFFILYYYTTLLNLYSAIGHVSTHWSHINLVYSRHSLPVVRPEYNRSLMSQQLRSTHTLCFQR